jgi:hypothetical protein
MHHLNRLGNLLLTPVTIGFMTLATNLAMAEAPNIGGDVRVSVSTEEITNAAVGDNASAQVAVGSFMEGETGGDLEITVSTGTVSNIAEGDGACSLVVIGSVLSSAGCISSTP